MKYGVSSGKPTHVGYLQKNKEIKVARNSLLARATCPAEHCHWITADVRNIQT